jgi:hypothetical protein
VLVVRTKSSADSISNGAPVLGRVAVATKWSGLPVLKKNVVGAAAAGSEMAAHSRAGTSGIVVIDWFILVFLVQVVEMKGGRQRLWIR